jgi:phage terminase large subunit-like protein
VVAPASPTDRGGPLTLDPLTLARASALRQQRRALDYAALTVPQESYYLDDRQFVAWVDGNQLGKSFASAYLVHQFVRGEHPTLRKRGRGPAKVLVVGESYEQMVPLMEKLWTLSVQSELRPSCNFEPGRGVTGKPPRLVYDHGPAAGAEIHFATYRAGQRRIAGGTYDLVICDEPGPADVFGELMPRLFRLNGLLRIAFTPVPDMYDQEWLKEQMETGKIHRHTYGLTEANLWPKGYPAPFKTQAEIDRYVESLIPHHRAMRVNGSLDPVVLGRWVPDYDDTRHVADVQISDIAGADWRIVLATDHGTPARPASRARRGEEHHGKQAAVLSAIRHGASTRPEVVVFDEHVSDRSTTPEDDASAILDMLGRNGMSYEHVDRWIGDIPTAIDGGEVRKSNDDLRDELAAQLGRVPSQLRPIETVRKPKGSVELQSREINTLCRRDAIRVNRRCRQFRAAMLQFNGDPHHRLKDVYDAGRYSIKGGLTAEIVPGFGVRY